MLKHLRIFALLFLGLPLSAHSSLYIFEYDGYIAYLNGNGLGYGEGQYVSGALTFDLANSRDDNFSEDYINNYGAKPGVDFVSGYLPPSNDRNMDSVFVYDSIDGDHVLHRDGGITITDGLYSETSEGQNFRSRNYALEINVSFDDFDWLTNGKLNEFSFSGNDFIDANACSGIFYEFNHYMEPNGTPVHDFDAASFRFYSAKLTLVDVPEPSPLLLFFCGGLILYFTRRFNFRINLS